MLAEARAGLAPDGAAGPGEAVLAERAVARARGWLGGGAPRVLNATGVPLHTNLGRAPLAESAVAAVTGAARGYAALEYDLAAGRRSQRGLAVQAQLRALTGAEAALVVNNNAAAVLLLLSALAGGRRVLVSRGELIEIGGSYRLPEVFEKSGAELVEVGTTNRTHLRDYERGLTRERDAAGATGPPWPSCCGPIPATTAWSGSPPGPSWKSWRGSAGSTACRWWKTSAAGRWWTSRRGACPASPPSSRCSGAAPTWSR